MPKRPDRTRPPVTVATPVQTHQALVELTVGETRAALDPADATRIGLALIQAAETALGDTLLWHALTAMEIPPELVAGLLEQMHTKRQRRRDKHALAA